MWGPDKYQEETPELMAAIEELRSRYEHLGVSESSVLVADGIVVCPTFSINNDVIRIRDGWYVEVYSRRAYTEIKGEPSYADPDLIIGKVLPALRQHQVLDDLSDID